MKKIFAVYYLILCITSLVESETRKTYDRYQIVEIKGVGDLNNDELYKTLDLGPEEDFEILNRDHLEGTADVLVKPDILRRFKEALRKNKFSHEVIDPDVGKVIREQEIIEGRAQPLVGGVTFNRIMEFGEIQKYLYKVAKQNKNKLKLTNIGKSIEGVNIPMVTISNGKCSKKKKKKKPVIFIESGIHAREWLTMATTLYTISQLLNSSKLTKHVDWQIIPVMNPDGYKYSRKKDRFWRKNRRTFGKASKCTGVDLNRNFAADWGGLGAQFGKCKPDYVGEKAFSEPESRAVRDAFLAVKNIAKAYISVHSYGGMIMWSSNKKISKKKGCPVWLESLGRKISKSIKKATGMNFKYGSVNKLIKYIVKGSADDWAFNTSDSMIVLTFELRGKGTNGFFPPNSEILEGAKDFWTAMVALHDFLAFKNTCLVRKKKDYGPCIRIK